MWFIHRHPLNIVLNIKNRKLPKCPSVGSRLNKNVYTAIKECSCSVYIAGMRRVQVCRMTLCMCFKRRHFKWLDVNNNYCDQVLP